ncbi:MAG: hypothetical protein KDC80_08085, partial [Saprospiraceae bacterium]|nr:hypothetical protein [Saprospiraceae bacterium]
KSLQDLFLYLRALRDQGVIRVGEIMAGSISSTVSLTQKIKLNILAPSSKEKDNYIKGANLHNPEEGLNNNANANLLSTILQISDNEEYILLTSDAEKSSLIRIDKEEKVLLEKKLAICQSPHHGAFRNHNNSFWRKRNKQENPIVAFSVGDNHYGHPNAKVVDFFRKNEFTIFSTNYIGGLSPDQSNVKAKEVSSTLDLISRKKNVNNTSSGAGDITLNIF